MKLHGYVQTEAARPRAAIAAMDADAAFAFANQQEMHECMRNAEEDVNTFNVCFL